MYVKILDPAGDNALANLTEHIDRTEWTPDLFEGLSFENVNPGGYSVASFTVHRPINLWWADMEFGNQVIIGEGGSVYWEGYIDKPNRKLKPDTIEVNCLGWNSKLNQLGYLLDVYGPISLSGFLINIFPYGFTGISLGTINTSDYTYPAGTKFAFAPMKYWFDCINELNAANNYNWGVWNDKRIDFTVKTSTIDWLVWTGDCTDLNITSNPEALCNYAAVHYTQDGSHYEDQYLYDVNSYNLYGYRWFAKQLDIPGKITTAGATQIGDQYLTDCSYIKSSASLTCNRIFDANGSDKNLAEVRAGQNIRVVDWLPTKETLSGVSDIATFQIKSAKYNHDNGTLDVTPTEFLSSVETELARMQAVGY